MNQELGFETIPFEITPEFQGEVFEEENERGGRRPFAGGTSRYSRSRSQPGSRAKGTKRPPIPKPRPIPRGPRRPWGVIREPYGLVSEPYPVEPEPSYGSERVRWVQDCLNQSLGLQIPVTGVMGPETHGAVRTFQKQQGFRVSGIVGPDTEEALKTACRGQSTRADGPRDSQEEFELGPLSATLTWLTNPNPDNPQKPQLFSRKQASIFEQGGIYIAVDTLKGNQILKVGKSRSFKTNPAADKRYIAMEQPGKRPGLRFYLATFTVPSGRSGGGVIEMIEDAIARLLYRAGLQLPEHGKPFRVQTVTDTVSIRNVLPPDLRYLLSRSYGYEGYRKSGRDFKKQIIPRRSAGAHAPASTDTLYLSDQSYPRWEIENNNFEPELFPILPWLGGRPHFAPSGDGSSLNFDTPVRNGTGLQTQYGSRPRRVGRIIVLPDDDNATLYGEIPIFYDGDDPDLFLGKIVKRAGRLAGQVSKTISKTVDTVKRAAGPLGGIADFAWKMSPIGSAVTATQRGLDAASAVVRGERIDRIIRKSAQARIGDFKERLKFAEMVAPFIPGLGTGVAAALGAANALASGKPITEALISAARSAIPGGRIAQAGFDMAMNVAKGKSLSESALATVRSQLPRGQQAAFDAGLALAQGKNLQQAAYKAAGRIIPPSPFAANALAFTRAATSGKNIQNAALSIVGQRVLQGKKVYRKPSNKQRELSFELIPIGKIGLE